MTPDLGRAPRHSAVSDVLATLNRLHIVLDDAGCFHQSNHRICLLIERGNPVATVDGHRVDWRLVVPMLKPRTLRRVVPRPEIHLNGNVLR